MDRGAKQVPVHGSQRVGHDWAHTYIHNPNRNAAHLSTERRQALLSSLGGKNMEQPFHLESVLSFYFPQGQMDLPGGPVTFVPCFGPFCSWRSPASSPSQNKLECWWRAQRHGEQICLFRKNMINLPGLSSQRIPSSFIIIKMTCVCVLLVQLCLTVCNPMDCSPPWGPLSPRGFSWRILE